MSDVKTSKHFNRLTENAVARREADIALQQKALEMIKEEFGDQLLDTDVFRDDVTVTIGPDILVAVAQLLRDNEELKFNFLSSITGIDYSRYDYPRSWGEIRFGVAYNFFSLENKANFTVRVVVPEDKPVPTLIPLWNTADWQEREVYDLIGVVFHGHPDLRRLFLYDDFEGEHPLRKDYPLRGKGERDRSWKRVQKMAKGEEA